MRDFCLAPEGAGWRGRFASPILIAVLTIVGCGAPTAEQSYRQPSELASVSEPDDPDGNPTGAAAPDDNEGEGNPTGAAAPDEHEGEAAFGSRENPYPFGEPHSRQPGFTGAGWQISIDGVTDPAGFSDFAQEYLVDVIAGMRCVVVFGTATLESLESDQLTSNPFGFPEIVLVADGVKADRDPSCAVDGMNGEYTLDIELAPGGSTAWYEQFLVPENAPVDLVAVEETVYGNGPVPPRDSDSGSNGDSGSGTEGESANDLLTVDRLDEALGKWPEIRDLYRNDPGRRDEVADGFCDLLADGHDDSLILLATWSQGTPEQQAVFDDDIDEYAVFVAYMIAYRCPDLYPAQ